MSGFKCANISVLCNVAVMFLVVSGSDPKFTILALWALYLHNYGELLKLLTIDCRSLPHSSLTYHQTAIEMHVLITDY